MLAGLAILLGFQVQVSELLERLQGLGLLQALPQDQLGAVEVLAGVPVAGHLVFYGVEMEGRRPLAGGLAFCAVGEEGLLVALGVELAEAYMDSRMIRIELQTF